ncbi:MAG: TetR/AcrR family transcriptional regulator [Alphaproteobacteria bacterium]|nr:TetR/AcrR family transcriptional regulator [Alphaproteobacteria bacterium]
MATKLSPEDKLVTAALAAIEKGGWKALSLTALARKAKIPPATLYELCPDKRALLQLIAKRVDIAALERAVEPDENIPPRDRAFDAIIGCFETMTPLKPAIAIIHADTKGDPGAILDVLPATVRSAFWIADSAGLPTTGWQGFLVTRGIGVLLAESMAIWLDDAEDLAKTMAHIDRRLRLIEEWTERLQNVRAGHGEEEPADAD